MRNLVEIIAIHFSVRRSRNQKKKFASFLVKEIKKSGHHIKLLRHKSLLSPSLHILSENKKEQKMVVVPYDTGSKMLIPRYKYYLLNATRNFRNEIANTTLYNILGIALLMGTYVVYQNVIKDLGVHIVWLISVGVLVIAISSKLFQNFNNRYNMSHRNNGVAIATTLLLEVKPEVCTSLFVDNTSTSFLGFQQIERHTYNRTVLILDTLTPKEQLYIVCNEKSEIEGELLKRKLNTNVELIKIDNELPTKSVLKYFPNGLILVSGKLVNNDIIVSNIRTSKDIDTDIEWLEMIKEGIKQWI